MRNHSCYIRTLTCIDAGDGVSRIGRGRSLRQPCLELYARQSQTYKPLFGARSPSVLT